MKYYHAGIQAVPRYREGGTMYWHKQHVTNPAPIYMSAHPLVSDILQAMSECGYFPPAAGWQHSIVTLGGIYYVVKIGGREPIAVLTPTSKPLPKPDTEPPEEPI